MERLREILEFYGAWIGSAPDSLSVYGYIGHLLDPCTGNLRPFLRLQAVYNGDYHCGLETLRPLFEQGPVGSAWHYVALSDYLRFCDKNTDIAGRQSYSRSGMMRAASFGPQVIAILEEHMRRAPSKESFVLWMHQGGKANEVSPEATAFFHRDIAFVSEIVAVWRSDDESEANMSWAYDFGEALKPYLTGAYVNYMDPKLKDWPQAYYGANYPKLLKVKKRWDPEGIFALPQGVGSTYRPRS